MLCSLFSPSKRMPTKYPTKFWGFFVLVTFLSSYHLFDNHLINFSKLFTFPLIRHFSHSSIVYPGTKISTLNENLSRLKTWESHDKLNSQKDVAWENFLNFPCWGNSVAQFSFPRKVEKLLQGETSEEKWKTLRVKFHRRKIMNVFNVFIECLMFYETLDKNFLVKLL